MKTFAKIILYMFLPAALCGGAVSLAAEGKVVGTQSFDIPEWFKDSFLDIEDDAIEAAENDKNLLVYFHLKNCPYCAKMLGDSFADDTQNVGFIKENFDSIHINIRGAREVSYRGDTLTEKQFARAIGVQYTPTLLFFDESGQAALTVSGYRSPAALRRALEYVNTAAYRRLSLTEYLQRESANSPKIYTLRDHPDFQSLTDLSGVTGPLMLIVEDSACDECDWVHDNILSKPDVREQLRAMTVARLDANGDNIITTPAGEKMTMAEFARRLNISYRPGVVFYENGAEIFRVTGLLNRYHFREAARYVNIGHRAAYPRWGAYLRARRQELLQAGEDVDYSI